MCSLLLWLLFDIICVFCKQSVSINNKEQEIGKCYKRSESINENIFDIGMLHNKWESYKFECINKKSLSYKRFTDGKCKDYSIIIRIKNDYNLSNIIGFNCSSTNETWKTILIVIGGIIGICIIACLGYLFVYFYQSIKDRKSIEKYKDVISQSIQKQTTGDTIQEQT